MKNTAMENRLQQEILSFIQDRKSLQLATLGSDGAPYASYAPFALGEDAFYVILSDIAIHGLNLVREPRASVLIIEDEEKAEEMFARVRINYRVIAEELPVDSDVWHHALDRLAARHGERPRKLAEHTDFRIFQLTPQAGRYVKGFGKAYTLAGGALAETEINHLQEGHRRRA